MAAADSNLLARKLEELNLLRSSLLPDETLSFTQDDGGGDWTLLLDAYEPGDEIVAVHPVSDCRFEVKVEDVPLHFEVELPRGYPGRDRPTLRVRGDSIGRLVQEQWQRVVAQKLSELEADETETVFMVHSLLCLSLLPLLHEKSSELAPKNEQMLTSAADVPAPEAIYHCLLTSHHLISPTKRRNLQRWSSELFLHGFAKVGHPGCIYAEGSQTAIEEFVTRIKAMQWLALRVRFSEPIDVNRYGRLFDSRLGHEEGHRNATRLTRWTELEKVGDVVQLMRHAGREEFVTEMGLGSMSSSA